MFGTDLAYGAISLSIAVDSDAQSEAVSSLLVGRRRVGVQVSSYARATRCPALTQRIRVPVSAMWSTDTACAAHFREARYPTRRHGSLCSTLRTPYALSGTGIGTPMCRLVDPAAGLAGSVHTGIEDSAPGTAIAYAARPPLYDMLLYHSVGIA
eukprot:3933897-Rhodomonas_salina.6